MLMKASSQSLTEQLAGRFSERIRTAAGAGRAPAVGAPVRGAARREPSTVVAAYDQLLAQGWWKRARTGASSCATSTASPSAGRPACRQGWNAAHSIRAARTGPGQRDTLIRGMFHKISNKPQPGMGVFPSDWLESTFMPAACAR